VLLCGCESIPLSPFTFPRVTGRVLAADTGLPLAGVTVTSGGRPGGGSSVMPSKGGELLIAKVPARTGRDGRFTLEAERVLTPFGGGGWFAVQLSFQRAGYERFQTNYSRLDLTTNAPAGKASLDAGDILLHRAGR
jgi:hypothetical protein